MDNPTLFPDGRMELEQGKLISFPPQPGETVWELARARVCSLGIRFRIARPGKRNEVRGGSGSGGDDLTM
jgi:hypothetical protein